jgi:hypothetical protein
MAHGSIRNNVSSAFGNLRIVADCGLANQRQGGEELMLQGLRGLLAILPFLASQLGDQFLDACLVGARQLKLPEHATGLLDLLRAWGAGRLRRRTAGGPGRWRQDRPGPLRRGPQWRGRENRDSQQAPKSMHAPPLSFEYAA